MTKGRATVLVEPNRLETWEVPVPDPEQGGVVVRVVLGGVCGSDVHIASGEAGIMPFPIILGHEGIGRIEKLSQGSHTDYAGEPVKEGDLIYWSPIALCHRCYSCTVLEQTPCENSQFFEHAKKPNWGSYADFACLPNGMAFFRLPDTASPEALAALGCALPTGLRGFDQGGGIRFGESVVVQGAGPVGLAATLLASIAGANKIIVIDSVPSRLEAAKRLGATHVLSMTELDAEARRDSVYGLVGARGPDIVVEAAGALNAFPEGVNLVGNHGRYIVLGLWGVIGEVGISPRNLTLKNTHLHGVTFPKPKHYYQAVQLAAAMQDKFPLSDLVTHRFSISSAAEALAKTKEGSVIKAVIDPAL